MTVSADRLHSITGSDKLPSYQELCEHFGYGTDGGWRTSPMSVRADSEAEAWTFALTARSRGWTVSDPVHNGTRLDVHHVTVWEVDYEDLHIDGRFSVRASS